MMPCWSHVAGRVGAVGVVVEPGVEDPVGRIFSKLRAVGGVDACVLAVGTTTRGAGSTSNDDVEPHGAGGGEDGVDAVEAAARGSTGLA
jgi:hypothetical protein